MQNYLDKVTHLTSVHPRYDTRIFFKICSSLVSNGYHTSLVVADGKGYENKNGVSIYDVGKPTGGRLLRMTRTVKQIYEKAKELNSSIYHLHDPELIPIGLKLKKLGKKVIFDVHENISLQIKNKEYLPFFLRYGASSIFRRYEQFSLVKFDALALAENSYLKNYKNLNTNIVTILNMPDLNLIKNFKRIERDKNEVFYIGGISNNRGFDVTVRALRILKDKIPDIKLHFVGPYSQKIINSVDLNSIKQNINFYGSVPFVKGMEYSKNAKVGISILKPIKNYEESFSTKIFEYMAIGLPVVISNFKIYKNLIKQYKCGICIDPYDSKEIANAIEYIIKNKEEAKQMGINGMKAVEEIFNWENEKVKLFKLYENL